MNKGYDVLLMCLRSHADMKCGTCPKYGSPSRAKCGYSCDMKIALEAADAIEELLNIIEKLATNYAGTLAAAQEKYEELLRNQQWVSVKERLPVAEWKQRQGGDILPVLVVRTRIADRTLRYSTKAYFDGKHFTDVNDIVIDVDVTHWMLMPEPPEEVES